MRACVVWCVCVWCGGVCVCVCVCVKRKYFISCRPI